MLVFLRCVAEAAVEKGLKGLLGLIPGGAYAYDVAEAAVKKYRGRRQDEEVRADIQELAAAGFEQARAAAVEAVRDALAGHPTPPREEVVALELWLSGASEATRQSLKRPDDPSGTSLPFGYTIHTADDVVRLLPPRPPRFTPGAALPGRAGWVLDRLLGVGGFGEVWLARYPRLTSLPPGAVKFGDVRQEAAVIDRVMVAGRHPHIVPLVDADLDGEAPWLMYEYVPGGTLADWVHQLRGRDAGRRGREVRAALAQLADAVGFFHRLASPVVHRDLKPANILLDKANRRLRITDFGIGAASARQALLMESRGQTTRGGRLLTYMRGSHTPLYASPQQKGGADPDPRDDVHALGVIAYQLLTGDLTAAPGADMADDLWDAGASDGLIELIGRCVARSADRRPADAAELTAELVRLREPAKEAARPDDVSPGRRQRVLTTAACDSDGPAPTSSAPKLLRGFIGQRPTVRRMEVVVAASKQLGVPLPHILFEGRPDSGKTTLAMLLARELGVSVQRTSGLALSGPADLLPFLTNLDEGSILHIDRIDRLPAVVAEFMLPAVQDFRIDIVLGEGMSARTISMQLKRFTLVGELGDCRQLDANLCKEFRLHERLDDYAVEDLARIIQAHAAAEGILLAEDAAAEVARLGRPTPRAALNRLRWVRDFNAGSPARLIDRAVASAALDVLGDQA